LGVGVFLFAPLLARLVLSVERLGAGPVRDDLLAICRAHRVKVGQILLWKTDGSLINAAVMGLVGPLRFVLLTDALIETMPREQVQAVMAHEIGHVRRHHMPWLVASLIGMLMLAGYAVTVPLLLFHWWGVRWEGAMAEWVHGAATVVAGVLALLAFGWISRRIERQADTFAVQHLSRLQDDGTGRASRFITPQAVEAMHGALGLIARLNNVDPHRPSWRHGSIAWRQAYLASIIGRGLDAVPIDRLIRRAKLIVAAILVLGIGASVALEWWAVVNDAAAAESVQASP
jgi:STE24 endopeptidase